jgi:ubiquinone/menaquinone biosynthesis C-methylase UbiE
LEVPETLEHLGDVAGRTILELGCGTGLYTRLLARRAARIIAVDFSLESLRINARHLNGNPMVALVRADVSRLRLRPDAFDLALTTLYSNLPTPALRAATNTAVHEALTPGGRYLVSAHHQHLRRRLRRLDSAGVYEDRFPVFYQCFTRRSLRLELHQFDPVLVRAIVIFVPYLSRFRPLRAAVSRLARRIPFLGTLGQLLLAAATKHAARHDARKAD